MESRKLRGEFDGGMLAHFGLSFLQSLLIIFTLGICTPWAICNMKRWEIRHTTYGGKRLMFDGRGHQLLGNYIKWFFLTIITVGIYGLWVGVKSRRWYIKHIRFVDDPDYVISTFTGTAAENLGISIFSFLMSILTLFIGVPGLICMERRWVCKNTQLGGRRMKFEGTGGRLFGKYLLWGFLSIITLGIFGLWVGVKEIRWFARNTIVYDNDACACNSNNNAMMPANGGYPNPYNTNSRYGATAMGNAGSAPAYNIALYIPSMSTLPYAGQQIQQQMAQQQQQYGMPGVYMMPPQQR